MPYNGKERRKGQGMAVFELSLRKMMKEEFIPEVVRQCKQYDLEAALKCRANRIFSTDEREDAYVKALSKLSEIDPEDCKRAIRMVSFLVRMFWWAAGIGGSIIAGISIWKFKT